MSGHDRSRDYVFTVNNPTDKVLEDWNSKSQGIEYVAWQLEQGEQKTPHLQGYVRFKAAKSLAAAKRALGGEPHMERRRGTIKQAIAYATKRDGRISGPWEIGSRPKSTTRESKQGERSDIKRMVELIKAGKTDKELLDLTPATFIRYCRSARAARAVFSKEARSPFRHVECVVIIGPTGYGKTRSALQRGGLGDTYILDNPGSGGQLWFDGYEGESTLLIDEFYGWIKFGKLLRILDGYRLQVNIKHGHSWANWSRVFITSNVEPREWYSRVKIDDNRFAALERRITSVEHITEPIVFPSEVEQVGPPEELSDHELLSELADVAVKQEHDPVCIDLTSD